MIPHNVLCLHLSQFFNEFKHSSKQFKVFETPYCFISFKRSCGRKEPFTGEKGHSKLIL